MSELNAFKEALKSDIQSLKKLEIATLPANEFYRPLIQVYLKAWLCYLLINTAILIITPSHHGHSFLALMGDNIFYQGLLTIFPMFMISEYVALRNQIKNTLQSSRFLNSYIKTWVRLYFVLYGILFFIFRIWEDDFIGVFGSQFSSMILSLIISGFALSFELQRLGLSALFETLSEVISKAKKAADFLQNEE